MVLSAEVGQKIATHLLEIKAIKIQPHDPFTWSSGWISPVYCDNRLTLSYPNIRTFIKECLAFVIKENYPETDLIAGVATAGIPQGALVADHLNLPYVYVRPKPKEHGMGKQIEGEAKPGSKVVAVEDLISTGSSSLKALPPLVESGCEVLGVVSIFDYGFPLAKQNFEEAGYPYFSLSNYECLLEAALKMDYIKSDDMELLQSWRTDPQNWGKKSTSV